MVRTQRLILALLAASTVLSITDEIGPADLASLFVSLALIAILLANIRSRSHLSPEASSVSRRSTSSAKKIVLVSNQGYDPSHDALLRDLIERKIELFCAVGRDCEIWEEVMDELVVGPTGAYLWHVTTTAHPDETLDEVIAFAEQFHLDEASWVEVIEV